MNTRMFSQDYDELKARCVQEGTLFEDPQFPARDTAIFYSRHPQKDYVWKRPSEICSNPQFLVDGATKFDVKQGELDNCWFISALASVTVNETLLQRLIHPEQNFSKSYGGLFRFTFWVQGEWQDIVVDDRLPTVNGELCFAHSGSGNEFWSALLEKAYAKLYQSYEALVDGDLSEAMVDFTGGVSETINLTNRPPNLFAMMLKASQRCSLMGCLIESEQERAERTGLVAGQNYSVTAVKLTPVQLKGRTGNVPLIRLRSPYGDATEWKGAWSDKSPEWRMITDSKRRDMGLVFEQDGEFWMSFNDFCSNFDTLEMCNLGPESLEESTTTYASRVENSSWTRRVNAGGCRNDIDTFWTNPQYRVTVTDPDEDDEDNLATVVICLMQKDRRIERKQGKQYLNIGFYIYELPATASSNPVDIQFFKQHPHKQVSGFSKTREVVRRYRLTPGTYVIVPCTYEPQQDGKFLLRIFTETAVDMAEMDEPNSYTRPDPPKLSDSDQGQDQHMLASFKRVSGLDNAIDAYELQEIIAASFSKEFSESKSFSIGKSKSMLAMLDTDITGKLEFDEFQELWNLLRIWKGVFKKYDTDKSGTMNSYELRQALSKAGFRISNSNFKSAVTRHCNKSGKIEFTDFILLMTQLTSATESFNIKRAGERKADFTLDEIKFDRPKQINKQTQNGFKVSWCNKRGHRVRNFAL